tara:strand:+ start:448 stop:609 length:162 start_codon:yes stop_codon:yes gene_type:complete
MTSKKLKDLRKEFLDKYSGKLTGYEHLDDGTGDYARNVSDESEEKTEKKSEKT